MMIKQKIIHFMKSSDIICLIIFKYNLRKLSYEIVDLNKNRRLSIEKLKMRDEDRSKDIHAVNELIDIQVDKVKEEIDHIITSYLEKTALRLILPIPDISDNKMWRTCNHIGNINVLTTLGISELRTSIRNERKAKRDVFISWITVLTGLIGTIIGLISVLNNTH